jgi:hypothetical protein
MKSFLSIFVVSVLLGFYFMSCQSPDTPVTSDLEKKGDCVSIQEGGLFDSQGNPILPGYDDWGYNYQAHIFNGYYGNYTRPPVPVEEGDNLQMKWNDAWLSNTDCNGDGLLDRHYGFDTYIGSGAWLTNHMSGTYEDINGNTCHWTYFVKIIAAPADAYKSSGIWYAADNTEIGPVIWGSFAIIQQVENDPCAGIHGIQYSSPDHNGFGGWN